MSRTLHGAGLRQNEVISIVAENRFEFPAIAYGALYLNAIFAPVNVTYVPRKSEKVFFCILSRIIIDKNFLVSFTRL